MAKQAKIGPQGRPAHEPPQPTQYDESQTTAGGDEEIIEYDDATVEMESLAQVEEAAETLSATQVDSALIEAVQALEQQMGGFEAILAAATDTTDQGVAGLENIMGFGIGEKTVDGKFTGELAVKVYVVEKLPESALVASSVVPSEVQGVQTDVESVGEVFAESFRRRYRPAPGGSSIAHTRVTAGTHGCLVVLNNNRLCGLSNNHVLANSNDARIGDPIVQPGPADGGRDPADRVGRLQAFVPIDFRGGTNTVDAAVVWTSFSLLGARHHCYQINPTPVRPLLNMLVRKCGRTTQHTLGLITGISVTIRVRYGAAGIAIFRNQVLIQAFRGGDFSQGGDSGSLIVTSGTRQPIALLFAGGSGSTFANPIDLVIPAIGIRRFLS
jgi:hypothetical protein